MLNGHVIEKRFRNWYKRGFSSAFRVIDIKTGFVYYSLKNLLFRSNEPLDIVVQKVSIKEELQNIQGV